jgi:hypothetical protein
MKTLASELVQVAESLAGQPRIYADANVPAGLVAFARSRLHWDVLWVIEHDDLRRAPDRDHFDLAGRLQRTLLTLDHDYLDDRRYPPEQSAGVLVVAAPDERALARLLSRLDRRLFRPRGTPPAHRQAAPLARRKLLAQADWRG